MSKHFNFKQFVTEMKGWCCTSYDKIVEPTWLFYPGMVTSLTEGKLNIYLLNFALEIDLVPYPGHTESLVYIYIYMSVCVCLTT